MNKTEWLSLRLRSEEIYNLVSKLEVQEGVYLEEQLVSELVSALMSMRTMTLQVHSQICSNPVELRRPEGRS